MYASTASEFLDTTNVARVEQLKQAYPKTFAAFSALQGLTIQDQEPTTAETVPTPTTTEETEITTPETTQGETEPTTPKPPIPPPETFTSEISTPPTTPPTKPNNNKTYEDYFEETKLLRREERTRKRGIEIVKESKEKDQEGVVTT